MEIDYRRDMNHNYMIVKENGHDIPDDYETKVISTNRIPGLLSCHTQYIDSEIWYSYDVTSLQKLTVFCESRKIGKAELTAILSGVLRILEGLEDYLLDFQHLVLMPSCVCIDFDTMKIQLMYVPFYRKDIRRSLRELTEYLLGCAEHSDQSAIVLGYRFYHEVQENNTQLGDLMGVLYMDVASSDGEMTGSSGLRFPSGTGQGIPGGNIGEAGQKEEIGPAMQPALFGYESGEAAEEYPPRSDSPKAECPERRRSFLRRPAVIAVVSGLAILTIIYVIRYTNLLLYIDGCTLLGTAAAICAAALAVFLVREKKRAKKDTQDRERPQRSGRHRDTVSASGDNEDCDDANGAWEDDSGILDNDGAEGDFRKYADVARTKVSDDPRRSVSFGGRDIVQSGEVDRGRDAEAFNDMPEAQMTTLLSAYRPVSGPEDRWLVPKSEGYSPRHLSGEDLLIGKHGQYADMVIDAPAVSRIHAKLLFRAGRYFVRDLSSRNGTYVNGEAICGEDERMLTEGDLITFADVSYLFSQTKDGPRCENTDEGV